MFAGDPFSGGGQLYVASKITIGITFLGKQRIIVHTTIVYT